MEMISVVEQRIGSYVCGKGASYGGCYERTGEAELENGAA